MTEESPLVEHAKQELELIGYPIDGSGDEIEEMMVNNILELVRTFANQGHSGFSGAYCRSVACKLFDFEPLHPLTGEDWEWVDVSEMAGKKFYQNKRCSHVFMDDTGHAYDIDGYIFREPNGTTFTSGESKRTIESFPYTPERTYIDVDEDHEIINHG